MTNNNFFATFLTLLLSTGFFCIFKAVAAEISFETPTAPNEIAYNEIAYNSEPIAVAEPAAAPPPPPEESGFKCLFRFFEKLFSLEKTKKGYVRIAYFGDSMIEGDIIVQALRKNFQTKFGGQGIGFLPLSTPLADYTGSIQYKFSTEWNMHSALKESPVTPGISGYVSLVNDANTVWTYYKGSSLPLANPTLFYGYSNNNNAKVIVNTGKTSDTIALKPTGLLNKSLLASWPSELKLEFDNAGSIPFYGVNFSGSSGVYIDDFPLRSSSGLPLGKLNTGLMNAFHREFDYDLLILHFGANVLKLKPKYVDYNWYANSMTTVVNHLKKCFPGADILIISEADKATKYDTELKSDTTVAYLIQAQEKYALNTGSAFIDLFQLMGGEGTMIKWAQEDPPLANDDYTHFNRKGGKKIGELMFDKLNKEYEIFKINKGEGASE